MIILNKQRITIIVLNTLLLLSIVMFCGTVKSYAGGDYDMPPLKGINTDNTITPGATVKMYMKDLVEATSPEIKTKYTNGEIEFYFKIENTSTFSESGARVNAKYSSSDGGYFYLDINDPSWFGKYIAFYADCDDSSYSSNTQLYKINNNKIYIDQGPEITSVLYSSGPVSKDITVNINGYCRYHTDSDSSIKYVYDKTVHLYSNGSLIGSQTTNANRVKFSNVPVKYGSNSDIKVEIVLDIEGTKITGKAFNYIIPGETLTAPSLSATRINSKEASLAWSYVKNANGYEVWKGNKKIKTVGNVNKCSVKGKGAGKASYKVYAVLNHNNHSYKSAAAIAKPKKNEIIFRRSVNYKTTSYATCPFRITKISLKGNTYTVTGYAVNNRIFKMKKYKNLRVGLYANGKKAFKKKYKSKVINCKRSSSKKIVLKIKGKKGVDLRNSGGLSYIEGGTPVWRIGK